MAPRKSAALDAEQRFDQMQREHLLFMRLARMDSDAQCDLIQSVISVITNSDPLWGEIEGMFRKIKKLDLEAPHTDDDLVGIEREWVHLLMKCHLRIQ